MPKALARLWLRVTDVRVERVQDISHEDAIAEGIPEDLSPENEDIDLPITEVDIRRPRMTMHGHVFAALWDQIHGEGAWERNDYVWVLTYERIPDYVAWRRERDIALNL